MATSRRKRKLRRGVPARVPERHPLLGGPMLARDETLAFVLANLLDFLMTYVLLYYSHLEQSPLRQRLIEGNRVAGYFIDHWGPMKGMLGFKLTIVVFICLITQAIAYRSETTARRVLNLGTLLTGCVVLYSLLLLVRSL